MTKRLHPTLTNSKVNLIKKGNFIIRIREDIKLLGALEGALLI